MKLLAVSWHVPARENARVVQPARAPFETTMNPLSVYLDQNTLSNLAADPSWSATELGQALLSPAVEVFVSPAHVLETAQAERSIATSLAKTMLVLCGSQRMFPAYEFVVADYFFRALAAADASAIRTHDHRQYHQASSARLYLGALGLLAHGFSPGSSAVDEIRRTKLINQVLHARAAADPKTWLANLLDCVSHLRVASADPLEPLDAATDEELRSLVARSGEDLVGLDAEVRRMLQKHRAAIAAAYGAIEIGACLDAALPLPGEIEGAFDPTGLAKALRAWRISQELPAPGVPNVSVRQLVQRAIFACANQGVLPASITQQIVLSEIEHAASAKKIPNAGVMFDADHAVYLCHVNVFVTDDQGLLNALRPIAKRASAPERPVEVCTSTEFRRVTRRLTAQ